MIKGSVPQRGIAFVNVYKLSIVHVNIQNKIVTDLKEEADSITIIVRKFNIPLLTMDRSSRQNINNETSGLSYTLKHRCLSDTEHTHKGSKNTLSLQMHINHPLGQSIC